MAKPTASFNYTYNGLSFLFKDRSSGIVTSYLWDFGDSSTSILQDPPEHTYATPGQYKVTLTVTNADGSSTYESLLIARPAPSLSLPILELVRIGLPGGIVLENQAYYSHVQKWQLFFQPSFNILDSDVFDETKWPSLVNVLISKLVIYDLILNAANGSMVAFINAAQAYNSLASQIVNNTVMVADYQLIFIAPLTYPITVNLFIVNGVSFNSGSLANSGAFLNWLNSLNKGQFTINSNLSIQSLGNQNILTTFNYTDGGGARNGAFTMSNSRVVEVSSNIVISGGSSSAGQLKRLETGPSVAEWYDSSEFWSNIFKTSSRGSLAKGGNDGSIIGQLKMDICMYAGRVGVNLSMCPPRNITQIPIKAPSKKC